MIPLTVQVLYKNRNKSNVEVGQPVFNIFISRLLVIQIVIWENTRYELRVKIQK